MRINRHWTRNNISAEELCLSETTARIISYNSITPDSKFYECHIKIKRDGKIVINATTRNHLYFRELPNSLFSLRSVLWNTTPNAVAFHYTQENRPELEQCLAILSEFDKIFSEISEEILTLLTQFNSVDFRQDSVRCSFFHNTAISKSGSRRERNNACASGDTKTTGYG